MKKIYLAGPDVFEKDALEVGKVLKALCNEFGFEGLFPLDNILEAEEPKELAREIRQANLALIRHQADIVIWQTSTRSEALSLIRELSMR